MRIFISWSGHESHQVACAIRDWLPTVLHFIDPWVSSEDIDKGARWSTEIAAQLEEANFGIICVVPDNLGAPWLNFEAGAISKSLALGRVAPILIGIDPGAVTGPLSQFQLTRFDRDDFLRLVLSINSVHPEPLDRDRATRNFDNCWQTLEQVILGITISPHADPILERNNVEEDDLGEAKTNILVLLARHDGQSLFADEIAGTIGENLPRTNHYLTQLLHGEYVYDLLTMGERAQYGLADKGREYLFNKELI